MMVRKLGHTCFPATRFFLAEGHPVAYNCKQQHPPRLSTMRTRGVTFSSYGCEPSQPETPATHLFDAHFGGFFMPVIRDVGFPQ